MDYARRWVEDLGRDFQRKLGDKSKPYIGPIHKNPIFPMFDSGYDTHFSADSFCIDYKANNPRGISITVYNQDSMEVIDDILQRKGVDQTMIQIEGCGECFAFVPELNPVQKLLAYLTRREPATLAV